MPTLEFKGKQFVYSHHLGVPFRELQVVLDKSLPTKGQKPSLDDNLIIHGDNLEALKALLPTHAGKVDCIFIDPPYNTGNEGWCYNDNVRSPLMKEWLKKSANPVDKEDLERHDKWLCMMWPRLHLLRELLSESGSLWMTIDDNEVYRSQLLLEEIFGESAYLGTICVASNPRGRQSEQIASTHEYIIGFAKNPQLISLFGEPLSDDALSDYKYSDSQGRQFRIRGLRHRGNASLRRDRPKMYFPIFVDPNTKSVSLTPTETHTEAVYPRKSDGREGRWEWGPQTTAKRIDRLEGVYVSTRSEWDIFQREYLVDDDGSARQKKWLSLWLEKNLNYQVGKNELKDIFGGDVFQYPKPTTLIKKIIRGVCPEGGVVLDSFSGSGTSAHAVISLNKEDDADRRFILVECEDYADTLTAERVRRVIKGYPYTGDQREELYRESITWSTFEKKQPKVLEHIASIENLHDHEYDKIKKQIKDGVLTVTGERKVEETAPGLGGSFTYCTLGEPIDIESLLTGKGLPSFEALARYVFYTATGQSLEKVGKPAPDGYIGETDLFRVHLFYQPEKEWLRSNDAALSAERVAAIDKSNKSGKRAIVFAVAKFMSQKELTARRIEFCQLPYAVHRILGD